MVLSSSGVAHNDIFFAILNCIFIATEIDIEMRNLSSSNYSITSSRKSQVATNTVNRVNFDQNFVFFLFRSKTSQQFSLKLKNGDIESFFFQINQK